MFRPDSPFGALTLTGQSLQLSLAVCPAAFGVLVGDKHGGRIIGFDHGVLDLGAEPGIFSIACSISAAKRPASAGGGSCAGAKTAAQMNSPASKTRNVMVAPDAANMHGTKTQPVHSVPE